MRVPRELDNQIIFKTMSNVDISKIPLPSGKSGTNPGFRYGFWKLEEWRSHPSLISKPANGFKRWNMLFPGFFPALAIFTTYVVAEKVLIGLGFIDDGHHGHGHGHGHEDHGHENHH